ncbi:MAG: histidine kinase [Butyrivibrio sp.]|nr:histidine kinase [Butyrivibrio sp.]
MLELKYVYTCLELWGSIFAVISAIYLFIGRTVIKEQYRALAELELTVSVLLFFDSAAWFFRGNPGSLAYAILNFSNYMSFVCNAILPVFLTAYVILSIHPEKRSIRVMFYMGGLGSVAELYLAVAQMYGFVYTINPETNLYQRGPGFIIWTIIVLVESIGVGVYVWIKRDQINQKRCNAILLFITLPILASIIQLFIYGFSLSNIAIIIVSLIMFGQALEDNAKTMMEQRGYIEKQNQELEDMRMRIAISQIKPHFLYNTLSAISNLCDKDINKAKEILESLADYLKENVSSIETEEPIPFAEELQHTKDYLAIEEARFPNRFKVEYDIKATDFDIPALTIQPIVENAVNHGVCAKGLDEFGNIRISTEEGYGYVRIKISDDGVGFDINEYEKEVVNDNKRIGIRNVRNRLKIVENAEMRISSTPGVGTTVEIIIPKRTSR